MAAAVAVEASRVLTDEDLEATFMVIQALGCLGISTENIDQWSDFTTRQLELQLTDRAVSCRAFRMNRPGRRLIVDKERPDGERFFRWGVTNAANLNALAISIFRQFLLVATTTLLFSGNLQARSQNASGSNAHALSVQSRTDVTRRVGYLLDEIAIWIAANFELPATADRPTVLFVPGARLAMMRAKDRAASHGSMGNDEHGQRSVVALYDNNSKTIFLSDDWIGASQSDQSILVHEMVHHLQNVANLKFECPMAKEKAAYLAQDKWLGQFGMSLEKEFDVDMFTVVISSACAY